MESVFVDLETRMAGIMLRYRLERTPQSMGATMSTLLEPIVRHLRDLAKCAEILSSTEATSLMQIAERLEQFGSGRDDLLSWLRNEIEVETAADELSVLLRHNYKAGSRELLELIGELLILIRIVRARVVAEQFPELSESIAEGPPSLLRHLIVAAHVRAPTHSSN